MGRWRPAGQPGSKYITPAGVRRLREETRAGGNAGVGLIVTVTRENQDVLAEHVVELVHELQPDNLTINLARGTALDETLLTVDPDRYREVVAAKQGLIDSGALPYYDFPLARLAVARDRLMYEHVERVAAGRAEPHLPCTAGTLSAVVFEDGSVHPCEILGKSIGNLNQTGWDLGALWHGEPARALRREIRDTKCRCTWECAQADNVLFRPQNWPRLLRESLAAGRRPGGTGPAPSSGPVLPRPGAPTP